MHTEEKNRPARSALPVLFGVAAGAIAGLLLAPRAGSELREEMGEWGRRNGDKARSFLSKVRSMLPFRVKAAAAYGAVKSGVSEGLRQTRERAQERIQEKID